MEFAPQFDLRQVLYTLLKMVIAALLVLPIGWNRQRSARSLGLRTFPLVAVASCAFVTLGYQVFGDSDDAEARVIQGLITGIGFLGGGAIVRQGVTVSGTATAASIWSTAALGAAVAWGRFEIAIPLAVMNFVTLWGLKELRDTLDHRHHPHHHDHRNGDDETGHHRDDAPPPRGSDDAPPPRGNGDALEHVDN